MKSLTLETFLSRRAELRRQESSRFREHCVSCLRPQTTCYCAQIRTFDPGLEFVILIHPIEFRRRLATGRLSHLCLQNSQLILGAEFQDNPHLHEHAKRRISELICEKDVYSVVLYPGRDSLDLGTKSEAERIELFQDRKKLRVFVIDGTWNTAGRMLRTHELLEKLPRVCFRPAAPSEFRVRKQPKRDCLSTVEAIHQCIELLGAARGFDLASRRHDNLLHVFRHIVDTHLELNRIARAEGRIRGHHGPRRKRAAKLAKWMSENSPPLHTEV